MIDICDFAVGLSRQLYGLTIATERPDHRMMEQWHPVGVVGVISAFNFPVAVWSWNAALALRLRRQRGVEAVGEDAADRARRRRRCSRRAAAAHRRGAGRACSTLLIGDRAVGEALVDDARVPVVSATGSTRMGRARSAERVARRFGRADSRTRRQQCRRSSRRRPISTWRCAAIAFAAMGTAGQRCTSLRRLIVHDSVYDTLVPRLKAVYSAVKVGRPAATARRWSAR